MNFVSGVPSLYQLEQHLTSDCFCHVWVCTTSIFLTLTSMTLTRLLPTHDPQKPDAHKDASCSQEKESDSLGSENNPLI